MFLVIGASAPPKAHAYIGQSLVESGATLTKEAENLIKVPDYIPKLWEGGGGGLPPLDEATAWTDFFDAGGVVPIAGSVLALGTGVGVGSAICNYVLELEGCWFFSRSESDGTAEPASSGSWVFQVSPPTAAKETVESPSSLPLYSWYWKQGTSYDARAYVGKGGVSEKTACDFYWPTNASGSLAGNYHEPCGMKAWQTTLPIRYGMSGRTWQGQTKAEAEGETHYSGEGYCPVAGPGSTACTKSPPSNWSERLETCLQKPSTCGLTNEQRDAIGQHIAATTKGGREAGISDPYGLVVTVPGCHELLWAECKVDLEELNLVPERDSVNWEKADVSQPATEVLDVPEEGLRLDVGTAVKVETNPDSEGMPVVIPDPEPHETYAHYIARLNPALEPTRETVSDTNEDVSAGPDAVLQVEPEPGTREDPATTTAVNVQTNPHDAPAIGAGSPECGTGIGEVDWSPLNQPLGSKFPFGVFGFFVGWIGEWSASGSPKWDFTIIPSGLFGSKGLTMHVDLASMLTVAEAIRVAFLFASFVGLLWFLGTAAMKIQGDNS